MNVGKARRLKKIIRKDGRTIIVPMDHGVTIGPMQGIIDMQKITNQLLEGRVDAILVHKGIAKRINTEEAGLIVMLSGASNLGPNPNGKIQVCSVGEALRLGADAVSVHVNIGAQDEDRMLANLGKVSEECEHYGLPLLAMMYPRGPKILDEHDVNAVAHAARIGAELGADIIKTNYTGNIDTFKTVTESCSAPVVIAGGPKCKSLNEILQTTHNALQGGAAGLSIGRNVFQCENPTTIIKALSAIVHRGASVDQAQTILEEKT